MIIHDDHESITVPVNGAKAGHRFTSLELNAEDFNRLALLPDAVLHEWVRTWQLGFRPGATAATIREWR